MTPDALQGSDIPISSPRRSRIGEVLALVGALGVSACKPQATQAPHQDKVEIQGLDLSMHPELTAALPLAIHSSENDQADIETEKNIIEKIAFMDFEYQAMAIAFIYEGNSLAETIKEVKAQEQIHRVQGYSKWSNEQDRYLEKALEKYLSQGLKRSVALEEAKSEVIIGHLSAEKKEMVQAFIKAGDSASEALKKLGQEVLSKSSK